MKVIEMGCLQLADGMVGMLIEATREELKSLRYNLLYENVRVEPCQEKPVAKKARSVKPADSQSCSTNFDRFRDAGFGVAYATFVQETRAKTDPPKTIMASEKLYTDFICWLFEKTKGVKNGHQVEADGQRRLPEGVSQDGGGEAPRDLGVEEAAQAPE